MLRRVSPPERDRLEVGDLTIDRAARRVLVRDIPVVLAAKEYDLLVKLAGDPVRVFTKEELLREVWGFRSLGSGLRTAPNAGASRALERLEAVGGTLVSVDLGMDTSTPAGRLMRNGVMGSAGCASVPPPVVVSTYPGATTYPGAGVRGHTTNGFLACSCSGHPWLFC